MTAETVLRGDRPLLGETRTGRDLPYMYVEKACAAGDAALLDGERVIAVQVRANFPWQREADVNPKRIISVVRIWR